MIQLLINQTSYSIHPFFQLKWLIVVNQSIPFFLKNGDLASSLSLRMAGLDLALQGFVVLLRVRIEIFDLEEADLEYILIQSQLSLKQGHD